jgi:hypothetical protein
VQGTPIAAGGQLGIGLARARQRQVRSDREEGVQRLIQAVDPCQRGGRQFGGGHPPLA